MRQATPYRKESISVEYLAEAMSTRVRAPMTLCNDAKPAERLLIESHIHRPGLALAGYTELFTHQRVQILGNSECRYLSWLGPEAGLEAFKRLLGFNLPCVVLTAGNSLPDAYLQAANERGVPIYESTVPTVPFMSKLLDFLEDQFALQVTLHGSLVDVYGIGLLLTGASGIGKSEIALDLVERGHRLVADDVVIASRKSTDVLMGAGTDLAKHFIEIRGLGILDVRSMFGVRAIRYQKRIEVVVQIHHWDEKEEYTRIGMVDSAQSILDVELPTVRLPITPGKNVTVICEVIAMNHLLRHYGYDPAEEFAKRLRDRIAEKGASGFSGPTQRGIDWFEQDME